ncbi:hypothetical protein STH947 [Symbiobacterium thermophilum IAM 14863]|uniref:Uncharacterized protein n=1 Tax=Symbiobacterium thermophilum (strain DSM 24528 / JCM 14929 / IAM 14863 / T) TaxID=292459 RepID=Q67QW1_SYMTH|nr:hypothetical protein STH947 [Symbiobacterium thermophilum IAM 14863]
MQKAGTAYAAVPAFCLAAPALPSRYLSPMSSAVSDQPPGAELVLRHRRVGVGYGLWVPAAHRLPGRGSPFARAVGRSGRDGLRTGGFPVGRTAPIRRAHAQGLQGPGAFVRNRPAAGRPADSVPRSHHDHVAVGHHGLMCVRPFPGPRHARLTSWCSVCPSGSVPLPRARPAIRLPRGLTLTFFDLWC